MHWQKEVSDWVRTLNQEIEGLALLSERLNSNTDNPLQVVSRFQKVIFVLKEGMLNLVDKSNSLLKFNAEPGQKLGKMREEYERAMRSLANLFRAVGETQPRARFSTFASRKRSLSRKEEGEKKGGEKKVPRNRTATPSKRNQGKIEKGGYDDVKNSLKELKSDLDKHAHGEYEKRIKELEKENAEIRKRTEEVKREIKENLENIDILSSRIEVIEKRTQNSQPAKKSRFLLRTPNSSRTSQ